MKNLFQTSVNKSAAPGREKNHVSSFHKRLLSSILLQVDTIAIISILFGGLMAIGKDSRPVGTGFIIAGFCGLLIYLNKDMSFNKKI